MGTPGHPIMPQEKRLTKIRQPLCYLDICQFLQFLGNIGLLPGTVLQDTEVADGCGGSVNRTAQVQLADDTAGSQVTGLPQQGSHFLVSNLTGAVADEEIGWATPMA